MTSLAPSVAPTRRRRLAVAVLALATAAAIGILAVTHNVPTGLSSTDRATIETLLATADRPDLKPDAAMGQPFAEQVAIVAAVQAAVLAAAPVLAPIPFDREREPRDLVELGFGECFDRSRAIEKALSYVGLKNRHAAVYSTARTGSALATFLTPRVDSHAVTEVLTEKGWMLVDSNVPWIGLTKDLDVVSLEDLQRHPQMRHALWHDLSRHGPSVIFQSDFTYLIGVYSRHGRFYPPYDFIPDVNFAQLAQNLVE